MAGIWLRWLPIASCLIIIVAFVIAPSSMRAIGSDPVLVGAGDIAACNSTGDEATAALLDTIDGTIFTVGDNVYESGSDAEFAACYQPSWGRHKDRTRPSVGNHEYRTAGAAGYFNYFGAAAGEWGKGYYSYDLGAWHVVALNSNCSDVAGGCAAGSRQERWLRADLAAHPTTCTVAYWHHPRFSSGSHGSSTEMRAIWRALYDYGADVVIAGHDHHYERFAPLNGSGSPDPNGIRSFVVGSGGKSHYPIGTPIANSEVRNDDTFGVLKLTLHPTSYDWEFVPEAGKSFSDRGSAVCVERQPPPTPTTSASTATAALPTPTATAIPATATTTATLPTPTATAIPATATATATLPTPTATAIAATPTATAALPTPTATAITPGPTATPKPPIFIVTSRLYIPQIQR